MKSDVKTETTKRVLDYIPKANMFETPNHRLKEFIMSNVEGMGREGEA